MNNEISLSSLMQFGGWTSLTSDTFSLGLQQHVIAKLGHGMDGSTVCFQMLQAMKLHPNVYVAEQTIMGVVRRPDLYTVSHPDPAIRAVVEAWLWPLLPQLLAAASRAFIYGTVPALLTWGRKDLRVRVPTKSGKKERWKKIGAHTHYVKAREVRPDVSEVLVDEENELTAFRFDGKTYGPDRVVVPRWDPEFGSWCGQGARKRAWRDFCEYLIDSTLENMYLERSVDAPRIAYSEPGTTKIEGVDVPNDEVMRRIGMGLRGSGVASLPGKMDANGNRLYGLEAMDIPARGDEWDRAIQRRASNLLLCYLVAPSMAGLDDAGGAAGKTMDGILREFIENVAGWVVTDTLQPLVDRVHAVNYGDQVEVPWVGVSDVGKANAKKTLLTVLGLANSNPQGEVAWRTDVAKALDRIGAPVREAPPEPFNERASAAAPEEPAPDAGPVDEGGRPRDPSGEREERREDAETEEGEDATGAEDEGDE